MGLLVNNTFLWKLNNIGQFEYVKFVTESIE